MQVTHVRFPVPSIWDLGIAIVGRAFSLSEMYVLVVSTICLLSLNAAGMALAVLISAVLVEAIVSPRSRAIRRNWRATRDRRMALNDAEARHRRSALLTGTLIDMVEAADRAWRVYIADAIVGRTQSVINDRPAPKVDALRRLDRLTAFAEGLNIALLDDDHEPADALAQRLPVPAPDDFAPDILSPTMMNMNAKSIAHASTEGAERASRRHRQAVAFASEFGPRLRFADRAIAALRRSAPPAGDASAGAHQR